MPDFQQSGTLSMRLALLLPLTIALAACGGEGADADKNILDATSQMDPAAAAAVENAVANGVDPQNALAIGGQAATTEFEPSAADRGQQAMPQVQARPNLVQSPNRKDGTAPPDRMQGTTSEPGLLKGGQERDPQPSGGQR
jgi:hypothetical protein